MTDRRKEWLKRRSQFNHGWLKHQVLGKLGKMSNVFSGRVEDSDFETSVIDLLATSWPSHRVEAVKLLESFERDCAPSLFLEEPPLSSLNGNSRKWVASLIDTLWHKRYQVVELLQAAEVALGQVDQQVSEFSASLSLSGDEPLPETIPLSLQPKLLEIQQSFKKLASVFEEFPKAVRVT